MKKYKTHFMRMFAMTVSFFIEVILIITSINLFGAPSVITVPLLISVFLIVDFLAIFLSKGDLFKTTANSTSFKFFQIITKIAFIVESVLAPILFTAGVITTVQNILERCW